MIKEYYLSILSGQENGLVATLFKSTLSTLTYPYLAVLKARNVLYKNGIIKSTRLPVKIFSVGNITTGGTGKTPLVELMAKSLHQSGRKVAILSRGYGSGSLSKENNDIVNDECLTLRENLKDVQILVGKDRVINGEKAIRDYGVDCIILDDGFQHFKLSRDLDIVVIDSLNPFGGEYLVPRGSLREPLKNLRRADIFIISHCDQSSEKSLKSIYSRLKQLNTDAPVCESIHRATHIENIADNSILELGWLKGKKIYGLSAIGNPESFAFTLKGLDADLIKHKVYCDHHAYTSEEIDSVISDANSLGVDAIVVTQKDIVKIRNMNIGTTKILSLKIELEITKGIELYNETIDRVLN
jgi:tetraacyldisaccharide 4'-kinase